MANSATLQLPSTLGLNAATPPAETRPLDDLPPSSRRVLALLREAGALTPPQLQAATGLPPRTVRFALRRLREAGIVESMPSLRDCRTRFVFITKDHRDDILPGQAQAHLDSVRALLMP